MNRVCLIGRLTRNPELKATSSGKSYCQFSLAVNRYGATEKTTDFIDCVTWGKSAENLSIYMKKGNQLGVTGSIQVSKYEDKNSNTVRYSTKVYCDNIQYLGGKSEESAKESESSTSEDVFAEFGQQVEHDYLD